MKVRKEGDIVKAVMAMLERLGYTCWRQNSGVIRLRNRCIQSGCKGLPDIGSFMVDGTGRALHIECKMPGEEPTREQEDMLVRMRQFGVVAFCVHSVDEAMEALRRNAATPNGARPMS